jgi:two-component system chemotaxis response regulator CheY
MRSLVAEDDATNRALLQRFLSCYGECDSAVNGRQAVEAVQRARSDHRGYDLVCMDLRLPEMDGQEAIREIRRQEMAEGAGKPAKIIVVTSHSDTESISRALLGRCNAYVVKPISLAKLGQELKKLGLVA